MNARTNGWSFRWGKTIADNIPASTPTTATRKTCHTLIAVPVNEINRTIKHSNEMGNVLMHHFSNA
jgi:hypothetical protein